jgi:hypothetical protein
MKKEWLTAQELAAELRMSPKSTQFAFRNGEIPMQLSVCSLVVAPGYI